MPEEKREQEEEKTREQLRSSTSLSDVLTEKRPGEESLWKGSLGGEPANEVFETTSALRDFTEEPNERRPDGYLPEEEQRRAG